MWNLLYRIANPQQPSTATEKDTDWNKCVICQQITGELLKCSADSKCTMDGVEYKSLTDNLLAFKKIERLPTSMFPWLKEGQDVEEAIKLNGMTPAN